MLKMRECGSGRKMVFKGRFFNSKKYDSDGSRSGKEPHIMASSLGLNKIKTRSGPLPQETFFGSTSTSTSKPPNNNATAPPIPSRLQHAQSGKQEASSAQPGALRRPDVSSPQTAYDYENSNESESPRFQALLRVTSTSRKRFPGDIKSFSHELNSKGVRPFPFWKPRRLNNLEEILVIIRAKFDKAKEEVNSDLAIFAADLVGILEKTSDNPGWQETIEDLLVLARTCAITSPGEFWLQCEGIVHELDDKRQELPPGMLKQLHTRMLFILTRCTRLLQFHKESGLAEDEIVFNLRQSRVLHSSEKRIPPGLGRDAKSSSATKAIKASAKKSYSQEQHILNWKKDVMQPENLLIPPDDDTSKLLESPSGMDRMASWKKFPSHQEKAKKKLLS